MKRLKLSFIAFLVLCKVCCPPKGFPEASCSSESPACLPASSYDQEGASRENVQKFDEEFRQYRGKMMYEKCRRELTNGASLPVMIQAMRDFIQQQTESLYASADLSQSSSTGIILDPRLANSLTQRRAQMMLAPGPAEQSAKNMQKGLEKFCKMFEYWKDHRIFLDTRADLQNGACELWQAIEAMQPVVRDNPAPEQVNEDHIPVGDAALKYFCDYSAPYIDQHDADVHTEIFMGLQDGTYSLSTALYLIRTYIEETKKIEIPKSPHELTVD